MGAKTEIEIYLANPRGFCAGVSRAIDIVEMALAKYGSPLYVRHEIVHNKLVVEELAQKGVIFVDELSEVPHDSNVIFSAHGVAERIYNEADGKNLHVIDATCPLVRRVHFSARKNDKRGAQVVLIGHKGHPEVEGTMGQLPDGRMLLVEHEDDVAGLEVEDPNNLAYITQTTLSLGDTRGIINRLKERFPNIMGPEQGDLCYATTNRQAAVSQMCEHVDLLLIIGSQNSSNCNRLKDLGKSLGVASFLVDTERDIDFSWFDGVKRVGISSGASTPEKTVGRVVEWLRENFSVTTEIPIEYTIENVNFALPKELRA